MPRAYLSPLTALPGSTLLPIPTHLLFSPNRGLLLKVRSCHSSAQNSPSASHPLHGHSSEWSPAALSFWPLSYHAPLPSASPRPASSHTWPPEAEPLCPAGSLCPDCSPAGTCTACHLTSWGVLLQHHLATLSRTTPPMPTRTLFPDCILFSTLTSNWNTYQFTILLYLY